MPAGRCDFLRAGQKKGDDGLRNMAGDLAPVSKVTPLGILSKVASAPPDQLRWTFERHDDDGEIELEVVVDARGLLLRRGEGQTRRIRWDEVDDLLWAAPAQLVTLDVAGEHIELPFDLEGEGGDFDELLRLLIEGIDPPTASSREGIFGHWRWGRLIVWAFVAFGGVAFLLLFVADRGHWVVGAVVSAMWLMMIRFGGLATECRLSVDDESIIFRRPWGVRRLPFAELSRSTVRRDGRLGRQTLMLDVLSRSGAQIRVCSLGDEVLDAQRAVRAMTMAESGAE